MMQAKSLNSLKIHPYSEPDAHQSLFHVLNLKPTVQQIEALTLVKNNLDVD
jgi:hypothetical protein